MKKTVAVIIILFLLMTCIPLTVFLDNNTAESETEIKEPDKYGEVRVFLTKENKTISVGMSEYLTGSVAAEMPPSYHSEALKAQAAVCYTYVMKAKTENKNEEKLPDNADISDDSAKHQGYMPLPARKEKFSDGFEAAEEKIASAVGEVIGKGIFYGDSLIIAAYHAISGGKTESSENIWGGEIDYLRSVQSPGDRLSPDYSSEAAFTVSEFKEKISAAGDVNLSDDPSEWIGSPERTAAGTVKSIPIGGKAFSGMEIRNIFGLRSPHFTVEYSDSGFLFKVSGYGHGCGMSQYGADYMARQGASWQDIIRHYYPGVTIEKIE